MRLQGLECIEIESSSRATTITVCNYETYQSKEEGEQQQSNNEATAGQQPGNNLPLDKELKNERRGEADPPKNLSQAPAKDAAKEPIHTPATLANSWVFVRRGHKGRNELDAARETFEEMIRLGCTAAQIAAEIDAPDRNRTETIWQFEKRVMEKFGLWKSGGKKPTNLKQAAQEAHDWATESNDDKT
jgi:hypothetical protein